MESSRSQESRCCKKDSLIASSAAGKHPLGFPAPKLLEKSWGKANPVGWGGPSQIRGSRSSVAREEFETAETLAYDKNQNCPSV